MSLLQITQKHENNIISYIRVYLNMVKDHIETEYVNEIEKNIDLISKWEFINEIDKDYDKFIQNQYTSFNNYISHKKDINHLIDNINETYHMLQNVSNIFKEEAKKLLDKITLAYTLYFNECKLNDIVIIKYLGKLIITKFLKHNNISEADINFQNKLKKINEHKPTIEKKELSIIQEEKNDELGIKENDLDTSGFKENDLEQEYQNNKTQEYQNNKTQEYQNNKTQKTHKDNIKFISKSNLSDFTGDNSVVSDIIETTIENKIDNIVENKIADIVNNKLEDIVNNTIETFEERLDDSDQLEQYNKKIKKISNIKDILNTKVGGDPKSILESFNVIRKYYHKYKICISLYAYVTQNIIDLILKVDKNVMYQIIEYIEYDKNIVIDNNVDLLFTKKQLYKNNPPLNKFNLLPVSDNMPLKKLLAMILSENDIKITNTNLHKISKTNKIGIIVFYRVVYTPIEYNIRNLILYDNAKNLIQPDEYGINKKTIERFNTIRSYEQCKWEFDTEIIGAEYDKFYIIETLDNNNYRCLAPWIESTVYGISKYKIKNILDYYSNNKIDRSSNYHALNINKATKNMFLSRVVDIETLIEGIPMTDINYVRNEITKSINNAIKMIIKKNYKNDLKNNIEVNNIIHNKLLPKLFYEKIIYLYKDGSSLDNIKEFKAGDFKFHEIFASFMVNLHSITRRFSKEMHDGYARNSLKDDIFKQSKEERMKIINAKLEEVVSNTIDLILKNDNNIYDSLHNKYSILNIDYRII